MGSDFFDELGETLTRTAKEIGERADSFFEVQKLRNKISTEQRMVNKRKMDIGTLIFQRYLQGEALDDEVAALCEEISCHKKTVFEYQEEIAKMRGERICPCCGASVDKEAAYCPKCGTPCAPQENKEKAEDEAAEVADYEWEEETEEETEEITEEESEEKDGENQKEQKEEE